MPLKQNILIGTISSVFFIFFFLNQLIFNIGKPLSDPDNMYQYFLIENNLHKWSNLDFKNLYDTRMFYPLKNTLALGNSQFVQSIMSLPLYLVTKNVIISAHSMVLINFFLNFLMMYLLVYQFTKSAPASILGGLIFSYNPYVMAQFYFELLTLFWIPLIFLVTEKMLEGRQRWAAVLPFLFLGQLISSFYYFVFLLISWPVYLGIRWIRGIKGIRGIRYKVLLSLVICGIIGAFYLQPYLETRNTFGVTRDLGNVMFHSAKLVDFISTTKDNKIYGSILGTKAVDYTEHSLFPGIVALGLLLLSLLTWKKSYLPFLVILVISCLLSFGPSFPPYLLLYKFFPFFDSLRAPSRFFVIGFFSLAILASFAAKYLLGRLGGFGRLGRWGVILGLIFFISLEYQHKLVPPFEGKGEVKNFYQWLDKQNQTNVILELPIANELVNYPNLFRSYFDDSRYLLYALDHKKKLINGNAAYNPPQRTALGQSLTINFPTQDKLEQLKKMGVDAIIVHKEEYQDQKMAEEVIGKLRSLNLEEIYTSDFISAFRLN